MLCLWVLSGENGRISTCFDFVFYLLSTFTHWNEYGQFFERCTYIRHHGGMYCTRRPSVVLHDVFIVYILLAISFLTCNGDYFRLQYVSETLNWSVFEHVYKFFGGFIDDESCVMWIEAVFPHDLPDQFEGQELVKWSQEILDDIIITVRSFSIFNFTTAVP